MKALYEKLPDTPGVYLMRDAKNKLLYVGKAANLRRRVSSYFLRPHDTRIQLLVSKIAKVDHEETDTAIEALILEAKLIKEHEPPFNIREKDDKSFLYVVITKEKCPRVILVRGKDLNVSDMHKATRKMASAMSHVAFPILHTYGPFTSASNLREALKIIRRIFPYNTHQLNPNLRIHPNAPKKAIRNIRIHSDNSDYKAQRPCFDHELGLCPGFCGGKGDLKEYRKNIKNIVLFFEGKKERIVKALEHEMKAAARKQEYETAEKARRQIFALRHIHDIALISEDKIAASRIENRELRIEGYDISNISGTSAVGSMVVFKGGEPDKSQYRKFKIKTVEGSDDTGMLTEVLTRRFVHSVSANSASTNYPLQTTNSSKWPLPDIILIDGGKGQVNAARAVLAEYGLKIPIVGLAKGPERKRNDLVGLIPKGLQVDMKTLIRVRDEAHRFAIAHHKNLRAKRFLQ